MASTRIVLILGAGPRVGAAIAGTFANNGYKVAVASRSGKASSEGYLSLKADFSKPDSIPEVFSAVRSHFNAAPNVVVYNAAALTLPPDPLSLLSLPKEAFVSDLNVNTVSSYVAAQQAVLGWESLPKDVKKTFIYTGNILNTAVAPVPIFLNLGVGKAASAFWVGSADGLYADKGFR
jgi:NAD(P)-dependent dehydrogenase (short-subunit alcohol dehydrogenase family)